MKRIALVAGALLVAAGLSPAAQASAPAPAPTTQTTFSLHAYHVSVSHRQVAHTRVNPRVVRIKKATLTVDPARHQARVFFHLRDLVRPSQYRGYTTKQYVSFYLSYGKHAAVGIDLDTAHPHARVGTGVVGTASRACVRSLRHATTHVNFKADTFSTTMSISCVPAGRDVTMDGSAELWVNPKNPPNKQVASDELESLTVSRHR